MGSKVTEKICADVELRTSVHTTLNGTTHVTTFFSQLNKQQVTTMLKQTSKRVERLTIKTNKIRWLVLILSNKVQKSSVYTHMYTRRSSYINIMNCIIAMHEQRVRKINDPCHGISWSSSIPTLARTHTSKHSHKRKNEVFLVIVDFFGIFYDLALVDFECQSSYGQPAQYIL